MAKRPFNQANVDGQDRRQGVTPKRQRKDDSSSSSKGLAPEIITSARQLQGLFAEYSNAAKVQAGIQSFKRFLAECRDLQFALHINEEVKLCALQEYLESQISRDGDEICGDLMQAWSFASSSNNFQLLSSVPTAIHLLLRTIALFPAWKKHGVALTKTVLQPASIKLVYRSLGGNKDAICSPCLRLLTEINKFDNGSLCPLLHQSLDFTVKDLARNLEVKKTEKTSAVSVEDPDRPSVRTVFVRFILSFFRYGTPNIKTDIMGLRAFTTPLFKHIRQDTAVTIDEILDIFKTSLDPIDPEKPDRTVADAALEFLVDVCTAPGNGVCFKDNGWYTGAKSDASAELKGGKQQVNNRILLGLAKSLRPYSNTHHLRLLIAVFTASPELVAPYFNDNTAFTFDPKVTATWIGLSAVMLETIQISVPEAFGYSGGGAGGKDTPDMPPPVRNTIENILPQQLSRTALTRCLTFSNNNLVRFIAIRILNAAFEKLAVVLDRMSDLASELVDGSAWARAAYDLLDEFVKRVPEVGTVVTVFNQTPENGGLQREAAGRLLRNYWEYLPSVNTPTTASAAGGSTGGGGTKAGFDFGPVFGRILVKIGESKGIERLEVKHCLQLAKMLPETRWWAKSAGTKLSPVVTLMKVYAERSLNDGAGRDVYVLLEKIVNDSPIFGKNYGDKGAVHPLEALVESFGCVKGTSGWEKVLGYLDNVCGRLVQSPYQFYDIVGEAVEKVGNGRHLSPLLTALFHQLKFVKREEWSKEEMETLCRWLLRIASNLWAIGEVAMVEREGQDILNAESQGSSSEVFVQFLEGVRVWRNCLEEFKIGKAYRPGDNIGFPMEFVTSSSTGYLPLLEGRKYLETLKAVVETPPATVSLFYWRWIQHVVENVSRITGSLDEVKMGEADVSAWELSQKTVFDAYREAARRYFKNGASESEVRRKQCLSAMVTATGKPLYADKFLVEPSKRLSFGFDIALIDIYSLLSIGSLNDVGSIKSNLKDKLLEAYERLQPLSSYEGFLKSQFETMLSLFFRKTLNVGDLKLFFRHVAAKAVPALAWKIVFERLYEAGGVVLHGEEVWGAVSGGDANEIPTHPWVGFLRLVREKGDTQSLGGLNIKFDTVYKMVIEKSSTAFAELVQAALETGIFTNAVEGLLSVVTEYLEEIEKDNMGKGSEEWRKEFTNLAFPICKAVKTVAMERDESTGRMRWKKGLKSGESMEVDLEWREKFVKVFYSGDISADLPIYQAILENSTSVGADGSTEYFEIGLDFGVITWDEKVVGLLQDTKNGKRELLSTATFSLFEAAYRVSQGTDMSWFHDRVQKIVYALTVQLSEPKIKGSGLLEFCETFGGFLGRNEIDLVDYTTKGAVDSLLEVTFEKLELDGVVGLVAGCLAGIEDVKYLQHSKLLQSILSSTSTALSQHPREQPREEERYRLAYIIRKLFFASKSQHCTVTTLDGVLSLYSGTNDPIDAVLLEIIISIEAYMSRSIMDRITSVSFTDDATKRFIERDGKGMVKVSINGKVLSRSLQSFFARKAVFGNAMDEGLKIYLEKCRRFGEEGGDFTRCETYDVSFLAALVMQGVLAEKEQHRLDVKDVVEKGALGVVLMALASEDAEERGMAEAVLTAVVKKLEASGAGVTGRGYRERTEVIHLLCKVLAGLVVLDGSLKENGIPTITALILARMVNIVASPGHFLYEKVMTWLQARATVDLREIPMLKEFLRSEGEGYWKEVIWILEALGAGMRRATDVEVCRKRGVFEESLGLYSGCASLATTTTTTTVAGKGKEEGVRKKVLEMLWNAAGVESAATTLITRTGIVSWIKMMICVVDGEEERVLLKRLAARLWEACDKGYVKQWSEGNIGRVLEALVVL
ncbi:hypothetical protein ABW20_dc0102904 [Dactylellina cionopaga]|nr:hypothetical protein ABW20_dc0102904 [Dactylellina cionopaga]